MDAHGQRVPRSDARVERDHGCSGEWAGGEREGASRAMQCQPAGPHSGDRDCGQRDEEERPRAPPWRRHLTSTQRASGKVHPIGHARVADGEHHPIRSAVQIPQYFAVSESTARPGMPRC